MRYAVAPGGAVHTGAAPSESWPMLPVTRCGLTVRSTWRFDPDDGRPCARCARRSP